jgi:predicted RNA-binding Zn-ribbon protein involved in translation (DUF1610 family)
MSKGRKWPITVFVCPNCGNYYGSSSSGDLSQKVATSQLGKVLVPRDRCPDCGDKRVPCVFQVEFVAKEKLPKQESGEAK